MYIKLQTKRALLEQNSTQQEQQKSIETATVNAQIAKAEREAELKQKEVIVKQQELAAEIEKKADADKYQAEKKAEAELIQRQKKAEAAKYEQEREADARKAQAEAQKFAAEQEAAGIKAKYDAEAAGIAAKGRAEAEAIKAKGLAEAEAMEKKAEAQSRILFSNFCLCKYPCIISCLIGLCFGNCNVSVCLCLSNSCIFFDLSCVIHTKITDKAIFISNILNIT